MLDEAALLVPDRTICNPINDFKLGGAALTDTSLSFVVSDMLNPPQQSTLNGAVTQVRFIQWERKAAFIKQQSREPGSMTSLQPNPSSRSALISAVDTYSLYRTTAKYFLKIYHKQLLRECETIK